MLFNIFIFIGRLSNASTFCSFIAKDSDEAKINNKIIFFPNSNKDKVSNSSPKLESIKIDLLFVNNKNKSVKSKDNKKTKCQNKKSKPKSKEKIKYNNINICNSTYKNKKINNISTPEKMKKGHNYNNVINKKDNKDVDIVNINKNVKLEMYTQNIDVSCMKKCPPKLPDLFNNEYGFHYNVKGAISSDTYGQLSKGIIPNIFYSHLMVGTNLTYIGFRRGKNNIKNYFNMSMTQRNKKKLLTIIYFTPL